MVSDAPRRTGARRHAGLAAQGWGASVTLWQGGLEAQRCMGAVAYSRIGAWERRLRVAARLEGVVG